MRKNLLNVTYTIMFMIFSLLIPHSYSLKTTFENLINSEDSIILKIEFDTIQEMVKYLDKKIIEINFDDEKFSYNKLDYIGSLRKTSITTDRQPNKLNISLRANKDYKKLKYKLNTPEIIEAKFKIIDKNIPVCETAIIVNSVDPKKKTIKPIYETSLKIGNPEIDKCKLKNLIPDIGTLSPNFDPEIYEYDMTVDCDVKSLDFEAIPMLEHLDVKIAHRNLSAPGKYTDITITVANPDLKLKKTYTVHVYREEKVEEVKEKSRKSKKSSSKSKSKNKSSDNKTESISTIQATSNNEIQRPETIINIDDSDKEQSKIITENKENINTASDKKENIKHKNKVIKQKDTTEDEGKSNYSLTKIEPTEKVSESKDNAFNLYIIIVLVVLLLLLIFFWIFKTLNKKKSSSKHSIKEISRMEDKQQ